MVKNQKTNDMSAMGNIEPSQEAFAYCQTCKKILETSDNLDEVKQIAQEHKLESGFEDHKAGFSLESYIVTD